MARTNTKYMSLDVGTVRTGVALADSTVRIAVPLETFAMDENTFDRVVTELVDRHSIDKIVVGYPRNQGGEVTEQTKYVERMVKLLSTSTKVVYQDESLTSVIAKERLKSKVKTHRRYTVDAEAAAIILQDYLELHG